MWGSSRARGSPCRWTPGLGEAAGGAAGPALSEGATSLPLGSPDRRRAERGLLPAPRPVKTLELVTRCSSGAGGSWNSGPSGNKRALSSTPSYLLPGLGNPPSLELPMVGQLCLIGSSAYMGSWTGDSTFSAHPDPLRRGWPTSLILTMPRGWLQPPESLSPSGSAPASLPGLRRVAFWSQGRTGLLLRNLPG